MFCFVFYSTLFYTVRPLAVKGEKKEKKIKSSAFFNKLMLISPEKSVCNNKTPTLRDKLLNTAIIFREVRNVRDFLLMHTLHLVAVAFGSLGTSNHFVGLEGAKSNFLFTLRCLFTQ